MTQILVVCKQWKGQLDSALQLDQLVADMKSGKPLELEKYSFSNPDPTGLRQYYLAESGPYGNPLLVAEPDRAIELPKMLTYVNTRGDEVTPAEKLGGFVVNEADGSVSYRYSLTNATNKKITHGFAPDGSFVIDGKTYWLHTLFTKDAKRTFNYDGFFSPTKTTRVSMTELADLRFGVKTA